MKDRTPQYPGRVQLRHVRDDLYDLTRADEAVEAGTPLNKSTLLTDETAAALGLDPAADPTVNDALLQTILNAQTVEKKIPSSATITKLADGSVSTHNKSTAAHSDIRSSISSVQTTLQNNINNVNTSLQNKINATNTTISNLTKCEVGTYVGTGVYGSSEKQTSITFRFVPKVVYVFAMVNESTSDYYNSNAGVAFMTYTPWDHFTGAHKSQEGDACVFDYNSVFARVTVTLTNGGKTMSWYHQTSYYTASEQLNDSSMKYMYIALG